MNRFIKWVSSRSFTQASRFRKPARKAPLEVESLEDRLVFDNTLAAAVSLGSLAGQVSTSGSVSNFDRNDFFRFDLPLSGTVNVQLSGLRQDANLELIRDLNNNRVVDAGDVVARSSNSGTAAEEITRSLAAGTYFARVTHGRSLAYFGGTNYSLRVTSDHAGNTLGAARNLGVLAGSMPTVRDFVGTGPSDSDDFYRFTLESSALVHIRLSGLSGDANLRLIADVNNNGVVDPNETLATSARSGTISEEILTRVFEGTFFVRINRAAGNTNYQLDLLSDHAGDTLDLARDLGDLAGQKTAIDNISFGQLSGDNDFYRFELAAPGIVNVQLTPHRATSLFTAMDVVRDFNSNGFVDIGDIVVPVVSSGNNLSLDAGAYILRYRVFGKNPNSFDPADTNYTLRLTSDLAGDTLNSARAVGSLEGRESFQDRVGGTDLSDFYRFNLPATASLNVLLHGLSSSADLRLIQDANNNGVVDQGEVLATSRNAGLSDEQLSVFLGAGTYFVDVVGFAVSLSTSSGGGYTLQMTSDLAGNTLGAARNLGTLATDLALQDFLGDTDTSDFYRFSLSQAATVSVNSTSGDDDVIIELIRDANNNGIIDPGEVIAREVAESFSKTLSATLDPGNYFLRLFCDDDDENYDLRLSLG